MHLQFRSFRTRILALVVGLLVLVQGAVLLSVHVANLGSARRHVDEALELTAAAFRRSLRTREEILVERARLLSSDFAFKQVVATDDRATILSALENHRARVRADVMMVLAPSGEAIADTLHRERGGGRSLPSLVEEAKQHEYGEASAIQLLDRIPFQLAIVPFFDPEPSAWIVIGFRIDDAFARLLQQETGTHVTLMRRQHDAWEVYSSTLPEALRRALAAGLSTRPAAEREIVDVALSGDDYVSWIAPLDDPGAELFAVLQRSLDEALEPFLRLRTVLILVFSAGILLSLGAVAWIANRVTRPVAELARGALRIEGGNYVDPVRVDQDDELGALAASFNAMMKGLKERDQARDLLGRVVAPQIAEELLAREIELGGEERQVTVLFADIRGFTSRAEREDPQRLVQILNLFLTALSTAIDRHGGVVEEYMGDGAKAIFGAPVGHADDPLRAVRAALALRDALPAVNAEIAALGAEPLQIGIGVHSAEVIAGRMGSLSRLKYTVVGDGVNVASRLEGLTRRYGVPVLVSRDTREATPGIAFREIDLVSLRGRDAPVALFEPLGPEDALPDTLRRIAALHPEALEHFRARRWERAIGAFEELSRLEQPSPLYAFYLERIARLRADPPGTDWDGRFGPDPG